MTDVEAALIHLARHDASRVVAGLARRFHDLDLADDAVQDALIDAARRWPDHGIPDDPVAWLTTAARRRAIDRLRSDSADLRRRTEAGSAALTPDHGLAGGAGDLIDDDGADPGDERLRLLLLCCHEALDVDAQVALTLRLVAGLSTEEIAAAFLVPTPTLAQRISRAKRKIRDARIPMSLPESIDERLDAVRRVIYLTFNEGYLARSDDGSVHRVDLCVEALRLAALVVELAPDHAESLGLLALLLFTHARRDARFDGERLVLLDDQNRDRWYRPEIERGNLVLSEAMALMSPGPFQMQAVIAAHHSNARTPGETDWSMIVALYDQLLAMTSSPVVALNRAAAVAMEHGPRRGLDAIDAIEGLDHYHLFHAARGELLARAGRHEEAIVALERAAETAANSSERLLLKERLARLL